MKSKKIILGQFYTSEDVAKFMISLSTKSKSARVLESGFGEGVFINSLLTGTLPRGVLIMSPLYRARLVMGRLWLEPKDDNLCYMNDFEEF